jgi:hypothetical protein
MGWPNPTPNPQHRLHIHGTPRILIVNSLHDPATGYPGALDVAGQIPNSTLHTYDGWGHGTMQRACPQQAMITYLMTSTPPAGTHCPAEPPSATSSSTMTPELDSGATVF